MYPIISIVTPSFNQGQYLEETILSVINQKYPGLEYIIIDGGSTDNSVEIIKKYEHHLKYWVSEPDSGQSNAINKGLVLCSGNLFNWINSDDMLEPGALMTLANLYSQNPEHVLFAGNLKSINKHTSTISYNINLQKILIGSYRNIPVRQQSNFFSLDFLRNQGEVNEMLHYTMDAELLFKILASGNSNKISTTNAVLGCYRIQPESKGSKNIWDFVDELYIMYFHFAKILNDHTLMQFFEPKIKNKILLDRYRFQLNETDFKKLGTLLHYQICNWVDYYYDNHQFDTANEFLHHKNSFKLTLSDNLFYFKRKIKMLIS